MKKEKDELVEKIIDGYKILELKGQGRYCKVYKAKDEDFKNSFVAIKVVEPEEEPVLREEAKILDKLQGCENIPRLYKYEDGKIFMEYFDNSLKDILDKKSKMDWKNTVKAAIDVLKALEHAHSKKQIHRDIKPSNILTDGKKYVLNDFNLANNLIDQAQKEKEGIKLSGSLEVSVGKARLSCVGGTEGYKAPEQIIGTSKDADERTDIYSLSAVLYEMITGKLPLGRFESPQAVPIWLASAIKKGLDQNKENRFKNAAEMRQKLEDGLEGKIDDADIEAALDWTWDKIEKIGMFTLKAPWYLLKYTVGAPITLTAYLAEQCHYASSDDPIIGVTALTGFLSLLLYVGLAVGVPLHFYNKSVMNELQNSDKRGKIAYVLNNEIMYYDASRMLEENKEVVKLCPKDIACIDNIVWSVDGQKLYFTGTYTGVGGAGYQIYSIDLEGKVSSISEFDTGYQLHKTAMINGKEVIYLKKGKEYYSFDIAAKKTERVAKVTKELEEPQTLSPDKKYRLYGVVDNVKQIKIMKGEKEVKTLKDEGNFPAWWHETK